MTDASRAHRGRPCAVYRWYDDADQLLYVGSSVDPARRAKALRRDQEWMTLASRHEVAWYGEGLEADREELRAIREDGPLFNVHPVLVKVVAGKRVTQPCAAIHEAGSGVRTPCLYLGTWFVGDENIQAIVAERPAIDLSAELAWLATEDRRGCRRFNEASPGPRRDRETRHPTEHELRLQNDPEFLDAQVRRFELEHALATM